MSHKLKVQFILKYREAPWNSDYGDDYSSGHCGSNSANGSMSSGLSNSAQFVCDALNKTGLIEAEVCQVEDNNRIDREVTRFRPDVVIIESFWVVPEKFKELCKLHPNVKWRF